MKTVLTLEYTGGLVLSIFLFSALHQPWWLYLALFFTPDLAMAAYLAGPRFGAACYNLTHHLAIAVGIYVLATILHSPFLQALGIIWLGHLFFDRIFGFGLKFSDSFRHTHLGSVGK